MVLADPPTVAKLKEDPFAFEVLELVEGQTVRKGHKVWLVPTGLSSQVGYGVSLGRKSDGRFYDKHITTSEDYPNILHSVSGNSAGWRTYAVYPKPESGWGVAVLVYNPDTKSFEWRENTEEHHVWASYAPGLNGEDTLAKGYRVPERVFKFVARVTNPEGFSKCYLTTAEFSAGVSQWLENTDASVRILPIEHPSLTLYRTEEEINRTHACALAHRVVVEGKHLSIETLGPLLGETVMRLGNPFRNNTRKWEEIYFFEGSALGVKVIAYVDDRQEVRLVGLGESGWTLERLVDKGGTLEWDVVNESGDYLDLSFHRNRAMTFRTAVSQILVRQNSHEGKETYFVIGVEVVTGVEGECDVLVRSQRIRAPQVL